jgi:anti-sigma-K factor RskA
VEEELSSVNEISATERKRWKYRRYESSDIEEAVRRVKERELTQLQASKHYAIPRSTLSRKVNEKQSKKPIAPPSVSSKKQQQKRKRDDHEVSFYI